MTVFSESSDKGFPIPMEALEALMAPSIWKWYRAHVNDVVFHVAGKALGWIPYSISIKVSQTRPLLEKMFGPEPVDGVLPGVP